MTKSVVVGIMSVVGCSLVHLTLGYFYTVGNMTPYLQEYMGITNSDSIWINTAMLACQAVSMPIGGILCKRIGFRLVTMMAMIMSSGGVLLTRISVNAGFGAFIATYSVMFGIGLGLPYSVLFSIASNWFPKNRAVIVGIISAGFGLGAIIFIPIQSALINPDSLTDFSDPSIKARIQNSFLIIGGILLGVQIVGLSLIRERKSREDETEFLFIESVASFSTDTGNNHATTKSEILSSEFDRADKVTSSSVLEAVKSIDFYILMGITFLDAIPVNLLASTYKKYGKDYYSDDRYLTTIATLTSVFNCGGRIIWGAIVDKFSFKCPLGWFLAQWTVLFATFPFLSQTSVEIFKILYPIWLFLLYFTLAGHFCIMPAATARIFGPENMSIIYGLNFLAIAPSSLILSAILSQFDIDEKWIEVYLTAATVSAAAFVLSLFLGDRNGTCTGISNICEKLCERCRPQGSNGMELDNDDDSFHSDCTAVIMFPKIPII